MLTELVPPHREQPTDNAMAPSDLRDIGPFLEALRHDPGLLLSRPLPSPTLPRDHLDATIGAALLLGIKHGFMHGICHSPPPKKQFMPGCIAAHSRCPGGGLMPVTVKRWPCPLNRRIPNAP